MHTSKVYRHSCHQFCLLIVYLLWYWSYLEGVRYSLGNRVILTAKMVFRCLSRIICLHNLNTKTDTIVKVRAEVSKEREREWEFRLNLEGAVNVAGALTWTWGFGAVLPLGRQAAQTLASHWRSWSRWRAAPRPSAGYLWCRRQWCWRLRWEQGWESRTELVVPLDLWRAQRPNSVKIMEFAV